MGVSKNRGTPKHHFCSRGFKCVSTSPGGSCSFSFSYHQTTSPGILSDPSGPHQIHQGPIRSIRAPPDPAWLERCACCRKYFAPWPPGTPSKFPGKYPSQMSLTRNLFNEARSLPSIFRGENVCFREGNLLFSDFPWISR